MKYPSMLSHLDVWIVGQKSVFIFLYIFRKCWTQLLKFLTSLIRIMYKLRIFSSEVIRHSIKVLLPTDYPYVTIRTSSNVTNSCAVRLNLELIVNRALFLTINFDDIINIILNFLYLKYEFRFEWICVYTSLDRQLINFSLKELW